MRTTQTLAAALWPTQGQGALLRGAVLAVAGVALLTASAKVSVPFYPVPMTLQTLAVLVIGAAYGARLGVLTVALYLLNGLAGLPVFANTPPAVPGIAYFFGPTGGFLLGFLASALITGLAADRGLARAPVRLFLAMLAAQVAVFSIGTLWLAYGATLASGRVGLGLQTAFNAAAVPYALGDLVKTALAALLIPAAAALIERRRG